MPLVNKTFSDIITFTRASTATYFDSAGVLQSAAIDVPRFDYNPATLEAQGLLIEEQRTNNLAYSQEFNNAYWTLVNATITADTIAAPDNTLTAEKLIADATNNFHTVFRTFAFTSGTAYTLSVFAKAGEYQYATVTAGNPSTFPARVTFDLISGTITETVAGVGAIQSVGNGWFRCSVTGTAGASASTGCNIAASSTGSYVSYTGDGTSGIYIWGAQLEEGAFPTSYIPTTTTALTRAADVASVNTLSPWFNAAEGTLYAEYTTLASSGLSTARIWSINDNSTSNAHEVFGNVNTRAVMTTSGVSQADSSDILTNSNSGAKISYAYATNNWGYCVKGGSVSVDTSCTVPSVSQLNIFDRAAGDRKNSGHIQRITYYPRRLSNAELVSITS